MYLRYYLSYLIILFIISVELTEAKNFVTGNDHQAYDKPKLVRVMVDMALSPVCEVGIHTEWGISPSQGTRLHLGVSEPKANLPTGIFWEVM